MVGGPEGGQLPVQGGGGDDGGHGAAEDDAHQDAATEGGRPHHPGHARLITINTPEMIAIILADIDKYVRVFSFLLPWTVHESYRGEVPPGHGEQGGGGPVDQVPVEEDGPEPLHPGRSVVTKQEERDEESPGQDRDPQLVCRGLHSRGWEEVSRSDRLLSSIYSPMICMKAAHFPGQQTS